MPDITMCKGAGCSLRQSCHRYTAKPSMRQAYFAEPPFVVLPQIHNGNPDVTCAYLIDQPEQPCPSIE